jgi:hypothetical protein
MDFKLLTQDIQFFFSELGFQYIIMTHSMLSFCLLYLAKNALVKYNKFICVNVSKKEKKAFLSYFNLMDSIETIL